MIAMLKLKYSRDESGNKIETRSFEIERRRYYGEEDEDIQILRMKHREDRKC